MEGRIGIHGHPILLEDKLIVYTIVKLLGHQLVALVCSWEIVDMVSSLLVCMITMAN